MIDPEVDLEINRNYTKLVSEVIKYIEIKKGRDLSLIDIISQFCFEKEIEPELMGDAIKNDYKFKSFISKDCETNKIKDW